MLAFQRQAAIPPTGIVDQQTWAGLFPGETIPAPALLSAPVAVRCLALTGTFETSSASPLCFSSLSGDFDGQGISFGALQWNLGRGTLQPLLKAMDDRHPDILGEIMKDKHAEPRLQTVHFAAECAAGVDDHHAVSGSGSHERP